jgi:hypothetical protein
MFMKHNMENESPHWRGRVWLNINYLVLSALDYYSQGWYPPKPPITTIDFVVLCFAIAFASSEYQFFSVGIRKRSCTSVLTFASRILVFKGK